MIQKTQITTSENINYNFRKQYVHKAQENKNFGFGEDKNTFKGIQISTI